MSEAASIDVRVAKLEDGQRRAEARLAKVEDRQDGYGDQVTTIIVSVERLSGRLDALGVRFWAICAAIGFGSSLLTGVAMLLVAMAIGGPR